VYVTSSSTIIIVCSNDENPYDANYESVYYNASNASGEASSDYQSAKMRSIFYEDANECQEISCFVEGVDSDSECQSPGHYEAIYEVINPTEEDESPAPQPPSEVDVQEEVKDDEEIKDDVLDDDYPMDDAYLDDSFDSDDSDDAYSRLQPQLTELKGPTLVPTTTSTLPAGLSCFDDKYLRRKYSRSQSHQGHSINKLAEAANLGMKRLRRNWSLTKNEVRTGLNRIKKKSAALSVADIRGVEGEGRKSSASSPSGSQPTDESHQRDNATFYLTLTIASNGQDIEEGNAEGSSSTKERRHSMTPSVSSVATTTSCETSASTKPSTRPISAPAATLLRNSSVGSNSGTLFRPSNPPPAPPSTSSEVEDETSIDLSKDALALRLNQLLLAGPVPPPGRRILRTSESISNTDAAPVALLPPDDKTSSIKHSIPTLRAAQSLRQLFPESQTSLNVPKTRNSVASTSSSHGSSEGYIRPSEIASSPPPLPARPTSSSYPSLKRLSASNLSIHPPQTSSRTSDGDSKSYLDLTYEANQADEEPPYVSSHFADEPLYQFYTEKVERAALYQGDSSEDDYEVINDGGLNISSHNSGPRLTAMELVTPADDKISNQEKKLQEAMFEVITSEASYLNSLEVLVSHFMNCEELTEPDDPVISRRDKNVLFSDILPVKKCSELFLGDLEKRWQESFYISSITDIVLKHTTSSFSVYVKYCSNQIYQDRKLRDLKENNPRFVEVLGRLEMSPVCQSLAMQSFLMLPMQRVTRLPLLIDAIFNRLEYGSPQWQECKLALASLQKIVAECNEAARKMERMEEMLLISLQLDFREVKAIPLISASRWLVKKGELTRLTWREGDAKLTFGRKILKHSLYFFLFTDLLVVTKKKSDDQYMVLDYCPRNMVQVLELENADKFPGRILDGHKNLVIMTMLQNHESKTVEMVLSCPFESDRSRWMEAVTPRTSDNPDERIYEEWDCPQASITLGVPVLHSADKLGGSSGDNLWVPFHSADNMGSFALQLLTNLFLPHQVQAIHAYTAQQPDELSLKISDVFNVLKKTPDGWYQGERLRDGARGWFPGNHTAEIASAHVRARNLRQRYRLLAISGSFVDELKKEKERFEKEERKKEKERRRTLTIKEVL
ncbi:Rho guanine nucleotide exchange factor 26, partial [Armadillidium vulgare]